MYRMMLNIRILTDFPWYFVFLCLLVGGLFSWGLYWFRLKDDFEPRLRWILSSLRFLIISFMAFLLMAPLVKRNVNQKEKPIVIIAQDNSQSIIFSKDSSYYKGDYSSEMGKMIEELSKDYDVKTFTYGSQVSQDGEVNYCEKITDLGQLFEELEQKFSNRNVGAMVLSGDGIYNRGSNPVHKVENYLFPVYTVALGDTSIRCDAKISNVQYNRIAYLDSKFPIEITVSANKLKGERKRLVVACEGKEVFSKSILYDAEDFSLNEQVVLEADKTGVRKYVVSIESDNREYSFKNNTRTIFVDVIDGHQKIGIIASAPHPDVAAIRRSLEQNKNYDVSASMVKDFKGNVTDYDLLILHQIPARDMIDNDISRKAVAAHVPTVFIIGSRTDLLRLSGLKAGIGITSKLGKQDEVTALFNHEFSSFNCSESFQRSIEQFPPLSAPFGEYKLSTNAQVLFWSKLGNMNTGMPMVAFVQQQSSRNAFVVGEGLWRWSLADYQRNNNHDVFDELIEKMVVFTSMKANKDRFSLKLNTIYGENEDVSIEAELYNDNYESVNTPDADLKVFPQSGTAKEYHFNRSGMGYYLNLGTLPPGSYSCEATTSLNGRTYKAKGSFVVEEISLEDVNLVANHSLLNTLASLSGGEMVYGDELTKIPELLKKRNDIKSIIYSQTKYTEMLNLPLLLLLIILLLSAEWITRKYNGEI